MKYNQGAGRVARDPENRAVLCSRFRVMCADAGLSVDQVAKLLRVTRRTVQYWFSGKVTVPYSAYKLVRIMGLFELPGTAWKGWRMHSGKLWSPEGHGFVPGDASWWSLLVRRAACFSILYDRQAAMDQALRAVLEGPAKLAPEGPRNGDTGASAGRGHFPLLAKKRGSNPTLGVDSGRVPPAVTGITKGGSPTLAFSTSSPSPMVITGIADQGGAR